MTRASLDRYRKCLENDLNGVSWVVKPTDRSLPLRRDLGGSDGDNLQIPEHGRAFLRFNRTAVSRQRQEPVSSDSGPRV